MTIQQIVDNRIREIVNSLLVCPDADSTQTDLEFLGWLESKFPQESFLAREKVLGGSERWDYVKPSRSTQGRRNSFRWGSK